MRAVETRLRLEVDGAPYTYLSRQLCDRILPFHCTTISQATFILFSGIVGSLAIRKINLLCICTNVTVAIRLNGQSANEITITNGGIYCFTNFQGVDSAPPTLQNNSGSVATLFGVVGGFE